MKVYVKYYDHYDESTVLGAFDEEGYWKDKLTYLDEAMKNLETKRARIQKNIDALMEEKDQLVKEREEFLQKDKIFLSSIESMKKHIQDHDSQEYREGIKQIKKNRRPVLKILDSLNKRIAHCDNSILNYKEFLTKADDMSNLDTYLMSIGIKYVEFTLNECVPENYE